MKKLVSELILIPYESPRSCACAKRSLTVRIADLHSTFFGCARLAAAKLAGLLFPIARLSPPTNSYLSPGTTRARGRGRCRKQQEMNTLNELFTFTGATAQRTQLARWRSWIQRSAVVGDRCTTSNRFKIQAARDECESTPVDVLLEDGELYRRRLVLKLLANYSRGALMSSLSPRIRSS